MNDNEYDYLDPNTGAQAAIQTEQISLRVAQNQPLPAVDSEDTGYLNDAEIRAIREQELVKRPRHDQKNRFRARSNSKCQVGFYASKIIFWIFILSSAFFFICEAIINKQTKIIKLNI